MCHGFHTMIHQSETLPFVGQPATHSCSVRTVSQAQQIFFSHLKNATLRINCVVFCVTSPLAHDCVRSLHRSINAVRRHEVVLSWLCGIFGITRENLRLIVISTSLMTPRDLVDSCGCRSPCMCGTFSVWIVGNRFLGTLSRYCLGRSLSFAMLPSLNTVECHKHGCVPCSEQTLFLFSTIWWSNSRSFLLSSSCTWASKNENFFNFAMQLSV